MEQKITKEIIQKLVSQNDAIGKHFAIEVIEFSNSHALCKMPLLEKHKNPLGIAHGGAIFSLADICFEVACHGAGVYAVNSQSSISFLNKGLGEYLMAKASLLKAGKKVIVYQVEIRDSQENLVAQGQITGYTLGNVEELINNIRE